VTDESGTDHATGCPTTQDRTVSVPVALGAPGEYTVDWRIVSADGHPTSGAFAFTYDPPAGASAPSSSPALDASPCGTASTGGATGGAKGGAADDAAAGGGHAGGATVTTGSTVGASDLVVVLGVACGVAVLAGLG